jgi:hypothetical protein
MPQGGKAMNQENTYPLAQELPDTLAQESPAPLALELPDGVMTPAMEAPEVPLPAAQEETLIADNDPANTPARTRQGSYALERLRNRMRNIPMQNLQWVDTNRAPIGGTCRSCPTNAGQAPAATAATAQQAPAARQTFSQGAALSTLLRSATRQHTPAPVLSPTPTQGAAQPVASLRPRPAQQIAPSQPQMRGALRQVVRQAQQPPARGEHVRPTM